jgi:hypothetical protein
VPGHLPPDFASGNPSSPPGDAGPAEPAAGLLPSVFDSLPNVSFARPGPDKSAHLDMVDDLRASLEMLRQATQENGMRSVPGFKRKKLSEIQWSWATEFDKSQSFSDEVGQAHRLREMVAHSLGQIRPDEDPAETQAFIRIMGRVVQNHLVSLDFRSDGDLDRFRADTWELNDTVHREGRPSPESRRALQSLIDDDGHVCWETFEAGMTIAQYESVGKELDNVLLELHLASALSCARQMLHTPFLAEKWLTTGVSFQSQDDMRAWVRDAADKAPVPASILDGNSICDNIVDTVVAAGRQLGQIESNLCGSLPFKDKLFETRQRLEKLQDASSRMREFLVFAEEFPVTEADWPQRRELHRWISERKDLIDRCVDALDGHVRRQQAKLDDTVQAVEALQRKRASVAAAPDRAEDTAAVPQAEEAQETQEAAEETAEPAAEAKLVPARLTDPDYRRDWFAGMLVRMSELAQTPKARSGGVTTQALGALGNESGRATQEARSLKDGYRALINSKDRIAAVERELRKLLEAAQANGEMIAALNDSEIGDTFPGRDKKTCMQDLKYCLARAAALETLLERRTILEIPDKQKIRQTMQADEDATHVPREGIEVVPTSYGPMVKIKLKHPAADGRPWLRELVENEPRLRKHHVLALQSDLTCEPDYWLIHIHLDPMDSSDPLEVLRKLVASNGQGMRRASCKLGDWESPYKIESWNKETYDPFDIGRGHLDEEGYEEFLAGIIRDNLSKLKRP